MNESRRRLRLTSDVVGRITSRHVTSRHVTSPPGPSTFTRKKKKSPLFFPLFFYQSSTTPSVFIFKGDGETERRTDGRRDRRRGFIPISQQSQSPSDFTYDRYPIVRRCMGVKINPTLYERPDPYTKKKAVGRRRGDDTRRAHRGGDRSNRDPSVCGFFLRFGSGVIRTVYTYSDETNKQTKKRPSILHRTTRPTSWRWATRRMRRRDRHRRAR